MTEPTTPAFEAAAEQPKQPKGLPPLKPRRTWLRVLGLLALLLFASVGYVVYDAYHFLVTPASPSSQEVIISIDEGATFDRVAYDLQKAGVITDVDKFRLLARYKKVVHKIQAGEFAVNTGWKPEQVLVQITSGKPILYKLSLREGLTWWETAKAVEEQGFASFADFRDVIFDPVFLQEHHIPFDNAEGFLFPDTYLLRKPKKMDKAQARMIASLLVNTFWNKTKPVWSQLPHKETTEFPAAPQGSVHKAMTVAANATVSVMAEAMEKAIQERAQNATSKLVPGNTGQVARAANATDGNSEDAAALAQVSPQDIGGVSPEEALAQAQNATTPVVGANSKTVAQQAQQAKVHNATAGTESPQPKQPVHPSQVDKDTLYDLVILASLVEKETAIPAERAVVAGVYANRLRIGMLLQCDPTIPYGVGESFSGRIRKVHLQDKSNIYNTYQHKGLPPGPICSTGIAALEAAQSPKSHRYLYFVATGTNGGHNFSRTLKEHQQAVASYRKTQRR